MGFSSSTGYKIISYALFDRIDDMWAKVKLEQQQCADRRAKSSDEPEYEFPTKWAELFRWYRPKPTRVEKLSKAPSDAGSNQSISELRSQVQTMRDELQVMTTKLVASEQTTVEWKERAERTRERMLDERAMKNSGALGARRPQNNAKRTGAPKNRSSAVATHCIWKTYGGTNRSRSKTRSKTSPRKTTMSGNKARSRPGRPTCGMCRWTRQDHLEV